MAITIEIQQITEQDGGTFSVCLNAVKDTGEVLINGKVFQCASAAELKTVVKPKFEQLIAAEQRKEQIKVIAQGVIDEIMAEVIQ